LQDDRLKKFVPPPQRQAWQTLQALSQAGLPHLRDLLQDPGRRSRLQAQGAGLTIDFSRQRVNDAVLSALLALADESQVMDQAQAMCRGEPINATEHRPVLHLALRGSHVPNAPWGDAISQGVARELLRVCLFAERVRAGQLHGFDGQTITDVVNLGIGGSDLGPRMTSEALRNHRDTSAVRVHYVSNVDAWSLYNVLSGLNPARTAFIVQSKTFTTQETLTLAASARRWLLDAGCSADRMWQHLVAVTAHPELAAAQGYVPENTFVFWDWVGGRYSVWSAIGLPLAIAIGSFPFQELLIGARAMDEHFLSAPAAQNLPLLMAMLGIWNGNFLGASSLNIAPYASALGKLAVYLQQVDMESNGKRTHVDGSPVEVQTAPLVWGGLGIDGQHAYFQLIHQGQHLVPLDFIGVRHERSPLPLAAEHHRVVLLNLQAQAEALAVGRSREATEAVLRQSGLSEDEVQRLAPHRSYPGNVPSTTIWMDALTPRTLGALMALYEHKVFCQAAIWGIHAFDQWGVELGKTMAQAIATQRAGG
jgi:glucose-6-phosphate isomerase